MKFGQFLIFTPNLLHGNVVNKTTETRFSFNIRLKSLFSPYNKIKGNDRRLGYFYFPLNVKPMTILGSKYEPPKFKNKIFYGYVSPKRNERNDDTNYTSTSNSK